MVFPFEKDKFKSRFICPTIKGISKNLKRKISRDFDERKSEIGLSLIFLREKRFQVGEIRVL